MTEKLYAEAKRERMITGLMQTPIFLTFALFLATELWWPRYELWTGAFAFATLLATEVALMWRRDTQLDHRLSRARESDSERDGATP